MSREAAVAAGDARFNGVYHRHYRQVLAYCLRRLGPEDAYSAANEVFAIAWRRLEDVPEGDAALPWLYVVAQRVVWKHWRTHRRWRRLVSRVGSSSERRSPDVETVVVQRAEYEQVLEAAARLSRQDREVLRLAAWEELPHAQIAEILGCSIAAVDQRLHRAKVRLAKQLHAVAHGSADIAAGGEYT